jgi:hypothetical protein
MGQKQSHPKVTSYRDHSARDPTRPELNEKTRSINVEGFADGTMLKAGVEWQLTSQAIM